MKDLELSFCDKNITPFGGMVLMKKMIDHLGFTNLLKEQLSLPRPGSNRGYDPTQLMLQFMISVWCGANAYEQCEVVRFDDGTVANQTFRRNFRNSKFFETHVHLGTLTFQKI